MKYEICLSNRDAIFDSASGFKSAEEAIKWGLGRGGCYVMQIGPDGEEAFGVSLGVTNGALISVYNPVAFGGWRNMTASDAADYVRRMIG